VITDPVPRATARRAAYLRSDELRTLELPTAASLMAAAGAIEAGLADEDRAAVERACRAFAVEVVGANGLAVPPVAVLGTRPHRTEGGVCIYEKFGDYDLRTAHIRVWMRTAMRQKVTAFGTLLHTLCHELCHHLDVVGLALPDTDHTRGFYERASLLYHHARGTPRRPLVWVGFGNGRYRLDWRRTMR
jgi:hypothetical protein